MKTTRDTTAISAALDAGYGIRHDDRNDAGDGVIVFTRNDDTLRLEMDQGELCHARLETRHGEHSGIGSFAISVIA